MQFTGGSFFGRVARKAVHRWLAFQQGWLGVGIKVARFQQGWLGMWHTGGSFLAGGGSESGSQVARFQQGWLGMRLSGGSFSAGVARKAALRWLVFSRGGSESGSQVARFSAGWYCTVRAIRTIVSSGSFAAFRWLGILARVARKCALTGLYQDWTISRKRLLKRGKCAAESKAGRNRR